HEIIGVEAVGALSLHALDFGFPKARLDRADHTQRDFILNREDVGEQSIVSIGPEVRPRFRLDELSADANAVSCLAEPSLKHIADAEFAPDLSYIGGFSLVDEA